MDIVERMKAMSLATTRDDLEALFDDAITEIERLRSLSEPVRDGYVMVPREPTGLMMAAFMEAMFVDPGETNFVAFAAGYDAMLSAGKEGE